MSSWSTRFVTKRLDEAILRGQKILKEDARKRYQEAADDVADEWGGKISASGRGGSHNSAMANINSQVTSPKAGGFFVRVGWFDPPGLQAEDGKTSWFVYQDTGYQMFGGPHHIPGLLLQVDMRQKLELKMREANEDIAAKVEAQFRGL